MNNNAEKSKQSAAERKPDIEVEQAGAERREQLQAEREKAVGEHSHENNIETARHEALEKASSIEKEVDNTETERAPSPAERRNNKITKADRDNSFTATMNEVQSQMSAPSKAFSKVIHNKAVEKVSDAAAASIARPNALLSGAVFAFILTLSVYLIAKNLGYQLSGFETIGAFILGWVIGILYDFFKVMITGRK